MRIESSTIQMASTRNYAAEANETITNVNRFYGTNGEVQKTVSSMSQMKLSQYEVSGGTSVFHTSKDGVVRSDRNQVDHAHTESKPVENKNKGGGRQALIVPLQNQNQNQNHWISNFTGSRDTPMIKMLRQLMDLLDQWKNGKGSVRNLSASSSYSFKAAAVSYQATTAMFGNRNTISVGSQSGNANGHWTRQTVQSGFVAGTENTAFCSTGSVVTSDGRTINFNISLEMSRSFAAAYQVTGKEEIFTDPLVINMDTNAAELSDVSFYFDLDCDGTAEEMSSLDASSGFLALDRNGDGTINNGSELFGAKTGDGFSELAEYDEDGNGWIDENDSVFSKLSVWTKCGTGEAQLLSLSEADVGAIFLGSQATEYDLADASDETQARIRRTGLYLKESGSVGTVQHVDFKA